MLLLLQQNNLLGDVSLVEVPDVVGETQAAATTELEGAGFVVSVATAYSSVVAAGLVISQDPAGGVEYPDGGTVTITVSLGDEPRNKGAGRSKRKRRLLVEIDGQDFEVSSPHEASVLLTRAKQVAEKAVQEARETPVRVNRGIQRPRITTEAPELKQVVAKARREIVSLYDGLARDMEIAALMARKIEDEEEEALIRLLM